MKEPSAFAKKITGDSAVGAAIEAFDAMDPTRGIFCATAALASQISRLAPAARADAAVELAKAIQDGCSDASGAGSKSATDYRTELNTAAAFAQQRISTTTNPITVIHALAHVVGQVAMQIGSEDFPVEKRLATICHEMRKAAALYQTLTDAEREAADRRRFDA